jgi:hypothetical protein
MVQWAGMAGVGSVFGIPYSQICQRERSIKMASFDDKEIKHVVVLVAMEAEGKPLIEALGLQKIDLDNKISHCVVYQGPYHNGTLSVVLNGKDKRYEIDSVGTTPGACIWQSCTTLNHLLCFFPFFFFSSFSYHCCIYCPHIFKTRHCDKRGNSRWISENWCQNWGCICQQFVCSPRPQNSNSWLPGIWKEQYSIVHMQSPC